MLVYSPEMKFLRELKQKTLCNNKRCLIISFSLVKAKTILALHESRLPSTTYFSLPLRDYFIGQTNLVLQATCYTVQTSVLILSSPMPLMITDCYDMLLSISLTLFL